MIGGANNLKNDYSNRILRDNKKESSSLVQQGSDVYKKKIVSTDYLKKTKGKGFTKSIKKGGNRVLNTGKEALKQANKEGDTPEAQTKKIIRRSLLTTGKGAKEIGAGGVKGWKKTTRLVRSNGSPKTFIKEGTRGLSTSGVSGYRFVKDATIKEINDFQGDSEAEGIREATQLKEGAKKAKTGIKGAKWGTKKLMKNARRLKNASIRSVQTIYRVGIKVIANPIVIKGAVISLGIVVLLGLVISAVSSVTSLIPSLSLKSEDVELTKTYNYITELDTDKTLEVKKLAKEKVEGVETKVFLNGQEISTNNLEFVSDFDKFLSYFDIKYGDYAFNSFIHGLFGGENVKDEIENLHDKLIHVEKKPKTKTVEQEITTTDDKGNTVTKKETKTIKTLDIEITLTGFDELVDNEKLLTKADKEQLEASKEVGAYTPRVTMKNPIKDTKQVTVTDRYAYRERNETKDFKHSLDIQEEAKKPILAVFSGEVVEVSDSSLTIETGKKRVTYYNITAPQVKSGDTVTNGQEIATNQNTLQLSYEQKIKGKWEELNPAFYLPDVKYMYQTSYSLGGSSAGGGITGELINPPPTVTKWRSEVERICKQYGLEEYVNVILAIIWEETGGDESYSPDIMQSSESINGQMGGITDPVKSIEQGVKHFASVLKSAKDNGISELAAIQSYNYGGGFISWLKRQNKDYSFEAGVDFSKEQSGGQQVTYTNPLAKDFGSWRYNYGNMFYVKLVTQHIKASGGKIVEIAQKELESGSQAGGQRYWSWYGFNGRVEWCATFVSYVADKAGLIADGKVPKHASCAMGVSWFNERGKYKPRSSGYTPQAGDIIYFDWSGGGTGGDHVGLVEKVEGNTVHTIEGNSGDALARRTYSLSDSVISGYGQTN